MNMIGGTLQQEIYRTAEMLVDIAETQGVYYVVAFLYDANYDRKRIGTLLPVLQKMVGSKKGGYND